MPVYTRRFGSGEGGRSKGSKTMRTSSKTYRKPRRELRRYSCQAIAPANPAGLPGGWFGFPLQQALRPTHESRRLARRMVRFSATPGTPPNARIPPACPADSSVFRYVRHSAPRTNPAGLPGGWFGFPLQQALRPTHESRRLARRMVRFSATPGTPPKARIPPACSADGSVFRYARHSAPRTNLAGLPEAAGIWDAVSCLCVAGSRTIRRASRRDSCIRGASLGHSFR